VYSHIPYVPLQDCDYRQNTLQNSFFYVRIKVLIVQKIYMSYFKFYYSLLNMKRIVIFFYFNVTIYIEFELLNY